MSSCYSFKDTGDSFKKKKFGRIRQTESSKRIHKLRTTNETPNNKIKPQLKRYLYQLKYKRLLGLLQTKTPLLQSQMRRHLTQKLYALERQKIVQIQAQIRRINEQKKFEPIIHRWRIASELLETESNYIGYLRLMNKLFREMEQAEILKKEEIKAVSFGFDAIHQFNLIFYKEIEKCVKEWNSNSSLASCFNQMIPYMGTYTPYINNYEKQLNEIAKLKKNKPKFVEYLKAVSKMPLSKGLSFESLTIMPVQRLPRYVLLLKELAKWSKGEEKKSLLQAASKMQKTTAKINEKKRSFENMMKILEIQRCIKNNSKKISLVSPSRLFISKLYVNFVEKNLSLKSVLLLFNDVLLLCYVERSLFRWKKKEEELHFLKFAFRLTKIKNISKSCKTESALSKWGFLYQSDQFNFVIDKEHSDYQEVSKFIILLEKIQGDRKKLIKERRKTGMVKKKPSKNKKIEINNLKNDQNNTNNQNLKSNQKEKKNGKNENQNTNKNFENCDKNNNNNFEIYDEKNDFVIINKEFLPTDTNN
ncbi:faciogenital dysplasia protein [Anaeramoeba flamelloides]|uniref:Faciogenital dysplasia protein n=1 Tax=Anaeramoeba flamelloides TaxID=1746091 RepID=A0ABQ8XAC3_9EUKA|nr:faciogenital dysplasia protein [Anaeramoeba flamelloides]